MKTLRYSNRNGYFELVMIDKIIRISKSDDGAFTLIHLSNGDCIITPDSINTLHARMTDN